MKDFEIELKQGFLQEAEQMLADVEQAFLDLESNPENSEVIDKIFRLAHNLKGSSKAVGFDQMGAFTHQFESVLLRIKNGHDKAVPSIVSVLLRCVDHISNMVQGLKSDLGAQFDSKELVDIMQSILDGKFIGGAENTSSTSENVPAADQFTEESSHPATAEATASEPESSVVESPTMPQVPEGGGSGSSGEAEVGRQSSSTSPVETMVASHETAATAPISDPVASLASAPTQAQVQAQAPATVAAKTPTPSTPSAAGGAPTKPNAPDESIRVSLSRMEKLINFVGELVILETVLREQVYNSNPLLLRKTVNQLSKVTKEVQDISMSLRMIPVKQTFQKMQRIVRDTATLLNKKIDFQIYGEETEVDRTVLERLTDPLVHMVRNSVDHGVEDAATRLAAGKPEMGTVKLQALHEGGRLVILITDDGKGINGPALLEKAIKKGVMKPGAVLSEKDSINLIFHPGFSTKEVVTEVSGRGVGMDVVRSNITQLQGEIDIQTKVGFGTTMKISLPLTLAIIDGMVVRIDQDRFVVPLSHVHESLRPAEGDIQHRTGYGDILLLRGENLPVYRLRDLLRKKQAQAPKDSDSIALVIRQGAQPFALLVDDIIGQHQVVVKKLGRELDDIKGFSGTSILGDGRPSLILELVDLIANFGGASTSAKRVMTEKKGVIAA